MQQHVLRVRKAEQLKARFRWRVRISKHVLCKAQQSQYFAAASPAVGKQSERNFEYGRNVATYVVYQRAAQKRTLALKSAGGPPTGSASASSFARRASLIGCPRALRVDHVLRLRAPVRLVRASDAWAIAARAAILGADRLDDTFYVAGCKTELPAGDMLLLPPREGCVDCVCNISRDPVVVKQRDSNWPRIQSSGRTIIMLEARRGSRRQHNDFLDSRKGHLTACLHTMYSDRIR